MTIARARFGVTVSRGNICCIGGSDRDNNFLDSVEVFDMLPGTWSFGKKLDAGFEEVNCVTVYEEADKPTAVERSWYGKLFSFQCVLFLLVLVVVFCLFVYHYSF